jgi:hypothetical protein
MQQRQQQQGHLAQQGARQQQGHLQELVVHPSSAAK